MPIPIDSQTDLRPTYHAKPDMRFATTFISNKYRDYAVKGETIMDKATGEIFTKRPEDGRVVSFFQNKKYLSDLMFDLRVLLVNNGSFKIPDSSDLSACYISTDYDMMTIYGDKDLNIKENDHIIPNGEDDDTKLQFNLSINTNGFFIKLTSRDADKAAIEWITSQYNKVCSSYSGSNTDFLEEKEKFASITGWKTFNFTIDYDLIITTNNTPKTYSLTDYGRINEDNCIMFPASIIINKNITNSIVVKIKSIKYNKIHFMLNHTKFLEETFTSELSKFIYPDDAMYIRYCNIASFIDSSKDIHLLGNEFIIALLDIPYVHDYMNKMANIVMGSPVIFSPSRPDDSVWATNAVWAEQVRDVFKAGYTINLDNATDINSLELYLAENANLEFRNISDVENEDDLYVKERKAVN